MLRKNQLSNPIIFQADESFNAEFLRKEFHKYGEIESIELMNNDKPEAYVTFANGPNAYLALIENTKDKITSKFIVFPADTWHQPSAQNTLDDTNVECEEYTGKDTSDDEDESMEELPPIYNLNEDCLIKLLEYCSPQMLFNMSKVCKLFNRLVFRYGFPRTHTLAIDVPNKSSSTPLAETRKILRCVGPYIRELYIDWYSDHNEVRRHMIDTPNNFQRFVQKLTQHVGDGVRILHFQCFDYSPQQVMYFKPIFQNLETLEMSTHRYILLKMDFHKICPKVSKLIVWKNVKMKQIDRPWPQLTTLKFVLESDTQLSAIAEHVTNLERLTIQSAFEVTKRTLSPLGTLENLHKLHLIGLSNDNINGILDCLTRFVLLRELKLHAFKKADTDMFVPNQQYLIALAQELLNLEHIYLRDMGIKSSTLVDFVQFSSHLKRFHLHNCGVTVTRVLISNVVKMRKLNQCWHHREPLQLFVDANDRHRMNSLKNKDVQHYLNINTNCYHKRA